MENISAIYISLEVVCAKLLNQYLDKFPVAMIYSEVQGCEFLISWLINPSFHFISACLAVFLNIVC